MVAHGQLLRTLSCIQLVGQKLIKEVLWVHLDELSSHVFTESTPQHFQFLFLGSVFVVDFSFDRRALIIGTKVWEIRSVTWCMRRRMLRGVSRCMRVRMLRCVKFCRTRCTTRLRSTRTVRCTTSMDGCEFRYHRRRHYQSAEIPHLAEY